VTDDVLDSDQSIVFQQAGNRLHAQKGLLIWLAIQNGYIDGRQAKLG
jgi:ornithine carbamoyltransferase